jgi:hypothetical protein
MVVASGEVGDEVVLQTCSFACGAAIGEVFRTKIQATQPTENPSMRRSGRTA